MIHRSRDRRRYRFGRKLRLRAESLEARRLLAVDIWNLADAGEIPFSGGATSLDAITARAAQQSYVAGELLVAVRTETIDPTLYTVLPPNWEAHLSDPLVEPAKTVLTMQGPEAIPGTGSKQFELLHINLGSQADVIAAMHQLHESHDVLWSQPNFVYVGTDPREYTPNDPQAGNQYHHALIGNDVAWDTTLGDPNIIVAITDDGVDLNHEDLAATIWTNPGEIADDGLDNDGNGYIDDVHGYNFLDGNNNTNSGAIGADWHGTHITGIVGAEIDNAVGVAGTSAGVTIMPLKWFSTANPVWTAAMVAETFTYATDMGAQIVNTSYNMDRWAEDPVVHAAFDYMYDAGVLHVNSAGNSANLNPPRQVFEQTLLVASTDAADRRRFSSNYGDGIDLAAPGADILSTYNGGGYITASGTSTAAPNAAGVAALIWSANPTWTRDQVVAQLLGTADNIDAVNPNYAGLLGYGRVNSQRGVTETLAAPQVEGINGLPLGSSVPASSGLVGFSLAYDQFMDPASVTDLATYDVRRPGADATFDTVDDELISIAIDGLYRAGTNDIQVDFVDGAIGIGNYRLRIASGGAQNPFLTPLDGDGDGLEGDDFEAFFSVTIEPFVETGVAADFSAVSAANSGSLSGPLDIDHYQIFTVEGESLTAIIRPLEPTATVTAEFVGLDILVSAAAAGDALVVPLTQVTVTNDVSLQVTTDVATTYDLDIYRNLNVEDLASATEIVDLESSFVAQTGRYAALGSIDGLPAGHEFIHFNDASKFVDISATGTPLNLGDNDVTTITTSIGNSAFPAGNVTIDNNGGLVASATQQLGATNTGLPNPAWDTALLPLWDDLDGTSGNVYWQEVDVEGIDTLIVQWSDRAAVPDIGSATFQVQVFESGPVLARFAYIDVEFSDPLLDFGASATIGYQQDVTTAVEFSVDAATLAAGDVLDLVEVAPHDPADEFSFAVADETTLDLAISGMTSTLTTELVQLLDPNGEIVATASSGPFGWATENVDLAIGSYTTTMAGVHTVRVTSEQNTTYALAITEELAYDFEPNNMIDANSRLLNDVGGVLGRIEDTSLSHSQVSESELFVDISTTGTALGLQNDDAVTITTTVGNDLFPAGLVTVANDGGIIAGDNATLMSDNGSLPQPGWQTALLPFWDDLDAATGDVYWQELQINGADALVVQWHDRVAPGGVDAVSFQVQLFADGPIAARFAYQDVDFADPLLDNGASATIGLQTNFTGYTVSLNAAAVSDGDVIDFMDRDYDIFAFTLAANENVAFKTVTPFDHPNRTPTSTVDPRLMILDSDGVLLVADSNGAPDGKNAQLFFEPLITGTYYVAVSSDSGVGDYVLDTEFSTIVIDGDFNDDGVYDCLDIDALTVAAADATHAALFDLTGDESVDLQDRDAWLAEAALANGFATAYVLGDLNLDGTNDGADFVLWNASKFTNTASYCSGDINLDGTIDGADFVLWNANKFQSNM